MGTGEIVAASLMGLPLIGALVVFIVLALKGKKMKVIIDGITYEGTPDEITLVLYRLTILEEKNKKG